MNIRSVPFALVAINLIQLPALSQTIAVNASPSQSVSAPEPCGSCSLSDSMHPTSDSVPSDPENTQNFNPLGPVQPCSEVVCDADEELYTWSVCIEVQQQPKLCRVFRHPYKVWFCPGHTWYKCYGDWSGPQETCTCTSQTPAVLPEGCTPPVDPTWEECN